MMNSNSNKYPVPTAIYHFTHIRNLKSLISVGGILCRNRLTQNQIEYTDSAFASVQTHRQQHPVPLAPYGTIHDYVPFYFNGRSPMLYTIKMGNITNVDMVEVIFFKSTAQIIQRYGKSFVFTDGHSIMDLTTYYNRLEELGNVPWNIINAQFWTEFIDGRRGRQAEFMVFENVDWHLIEAIGVYSIGVKHYVEQVMQNLPCQPPVMVKPGWYF